jgi:hypothetical protein
MIMEIDTHTQNWLNKIKEKKYLIKLYLLEIPSNLFIFKNKVQLYKT